MSKISKLRGKKARREKECVWGAKNLDTMNGQERPC